MIETVIGNELIINPVGKFFMTVKIGQYPTVDALYEAIIKSGKKIDENAYHVMKKISINKVEALINLREVTCFDLGFTHGVSFSEFCGRALEMEFKVSQAEAIVLAFIQNNDGIWRTGWMDQLVDLNGNPSMFQFISYRNSLSLTTEYYDSDYLIDPNKTWIMTY